MPDDSRIAPLSKVMRGEPYDEGVDVYSFGLVLLQMSIVKGDIFGFINERWRIAHGKAKGTKSAMRLINAMVQDEWRPITAGDPVPLAPPTISNLVVRCCLPDPRARPSFVEILESLRELAKDDLGLLGSFRQTASFASFSESPREPADKVERPLEWATVPEIKQTGDTGTRFQTALPSVPSSDAMQPSPPQSPPAASIEMERGKKPHQNETEDLAVPHLPKPTTDPHDTSAEGPSWPSEDRVEEQTMLGQPQRHTGPAAGVELAESSKESEVIETFARSFAKEAGAEFAGVGV